MKYCFRSKKRSVVLVMMIVLCLNNGLLYCFGEEEDYSMESSEILSPMEREEQEALYSAIQGFVGKWWNGSDLYPDPCGWTPIQGVSCDLFDGLWYVTALSIGAVHENSLQCATSVDFRPQLYELKHLKSLSFSNCFTVNRHPVSIPSTNWEKLAPTLVSMEFRSNPGLTGQIPVNIAKLVKLKSLVLIENGLTGQIPSGIANLVNLERLVLAGNKLTGKIPDSFRGLSQLLIVDLSRNFLSGPLPLTLGSLSSLLKLDLSHNMLEGNIPTEIAGMTSLTLLDLGNNKLSGGLANIISDSLEQIVLSHNPIGGELKVLQWRNLARLAVLDLSNTSLSGEIPDFVSALTRLRFLGLSDNALSGGLSPKIAALPFAGALYFNGNNLTGELEFSDWFYGKMGRRFGAWGNPNLCYRARSSPARRNTPFGVRPCEPNVHYALLGVRDDQGLNRNSPLVVASAGIAGEVGLWWRLFIVKIMVLMMVFSCL